MKGAFISEQSYRIALQIYEKNEQRANRDIEEIAQLVARAVVLFFLCDGIRTRILYTLSNCSTYGVRSTA